MLETVNLETKLPPLVVGNLQIAGEIAASQGNNLYLVGGVVRDLILGRTVSDLDLVLEGDAIKLGQRLAEVAQGGITTHARFKTAKIRWGSWSFDLVTARSETYDRPGVLPRVKPDSLDSDLFRRDFTINAMAIELNPNRHGQLIDPHGGREDLNKGLIRVLHEKSFIDDATRIWRALRYEQRLNFQIEADTLELLRRDVPMLDTISRDRIRHELELALKDEYPEKIIGRAAELGVLARLHPALKEGDWLVDKIARARQLTLPKLALPLVYMSLIVYRLGREECQEVIARLRLTKSASRVLQDTINLKDNRGALMTANLPPSRIYSLLHSYPLPAIMANYLAGDSYVVSRHLYRFVTRYRYVKPSLNGNSLKKMGIAPGPQIKEILQQLREARLDGKAKTKREEEELVRGWV